ncbi:hypothetical protein MRX96_038466 [Rhipicephalus microplus]
MDVWTFIRVRPTPLTVRAWAARDTVATKLQPTETEVWVSATINDRRRRRYGSGYTSVIEGSGDVNMTAAAHGAGLVTRTMSELHVSDLRSELDKRGLEKTGSKAALIDRLPQAMRNEGENAETYQFTVQVEPTSTTSVSSETAAVNTDAQDCGEQLAKKAKDTRKTWPEEEPIAGWVMCNGCEVWIQLEHTPFATTNEAGEAETYLCKHCEWFRLLKEEFLLMTREMGKKWRLAMQHIATSLTEHIDNTAKERRAVREELPEERNWRTALCAQVK